MIMQTREHIFEIRRDMIDVTSMYRVDESWKYVDKVEHTHQWYVEIEGELMQAERYNPQVKYLLPTLVEVVDAPATDEYPEDVHYECSQCGEHVTPGITADAVEMQVAGVIRYFVDGEPVSANDFFRLVKEVNEK